jgi:hypothetical protein
VDVDDTIIGILAVEAPFVRFVTVLEPMITYHIRILQRLSDEGPERGDALGWRLSGQQS